MRTTLTILCAFMFFTVSLGSLRAGSARKATYVTVAAGSLDRLGAVVSFALPPSLNAASYVLRDESSRAIVPLQIDSSRRATFVLTSLDAGATKSYRIEKAKPMRMGPNGVEVSDDGKKLVVKSGGKEVIGFQTRAELPAPGIKPVFLRAGYIHPVYTPSGRLVTDDYPSDHFHHHGIWAAWTKTEFEGRHPDFWNVGDGTGRIDFVGIDRTWNGAVHGGFRSRQRYVDLSGPQPKTALEETWEVTAYRGNSQGRSFTMFDLVVTQECATSSPLALDEYRYGGVGVRGHREWKDKGKISFLTSEGKDRGNGNATRARWCHIGGTVEGHVVGIATFDHPTNFRAPQSMRINPDDPFFNWAPSQLGPFKIEPGRPLTLRYRFVVADGAADKAELDRLWNDYANPPTVTVTSK